MLASKAGSARVSLMLKFKDDVPAGGLLFTFTGANKEADRQKVQDMLIPFVSAHRGAAGSSTSTPASGGTPAAAGGTPASAAAAVSKGSAVGTPAGSTPGTPGTPGTPSVRATVKRKADDSGADPAVMRHVNALRQRVLKKNATLKLLHRELVIGRQITEDEFWDGREALLRAEELANAQRPGRPSRLLDDRFNLDLSGAKKKDPKKIEGGTGVGIKQANKDSVVLNITKELTREIFEEFPVVQDAYAKNVPDNVDEGQFWKRYFESSLWEQHRASVRKTAADDGMRKRDDIFDVYLEDPDWDPQPRRKIPDGAVERYLDLAATEEDHGDATMIKDVTMQAGKERGTLPLIRRFNAHSEKLVRAGKKPGDASSSTTDLYDQIEYDDLRAPAAPEPIPLHVADTSTKDDSNKGILPGRADVELLAMASAEAASVAGWNADFGSVCMANPANPTHGGADDAAHVEKFAYQRDAQFVATRAVRDMHQASNAEDAIHPPLPEAIMHQMRSCHNAASEFLRQYWSAILPPPPGALGGQTPQQRVQRAEKMAQYLQGTEGKINAIVTTAEIARVDPERVRAVSRDTCRFVVADCYIGTCTDTWCCQCRAPEREGALGGQVEQRRGSAMYHVDHTLLALAAV
jgi:transcription initiation factor TFIIH subunit 1